MASRLRASRLRFLPLAVLIPVSLAMLFSPGSTVPSGPPNSDKLVHGLLFAALAVGAVVAGAKARWATPVLLAYAAGSEVLQAVLPIHRGGDVWDFAADALGVCIGLAAGTAAFPTPKPGAHTPNG